MHINYNYHDSTPMPLAVRALVVMLVCGTVFAFLVFLEVSK